MCWIDIGTGQAPLRCYMIWDGHHLRNRGDYRGWHWCIRLTMGLLPSTTSAIEHQLIQHTVHTDHTRKHTVLHTKTDYLQNSFFVCNVRDWNGLPNTTFTATTVNAFRTSRGMSERSRVIWVVDAHTAWMIVCFLACTINYWFFIFYLFFVLCKLILHVFRQYIGRIVSLT